MCFEVLPSTVMTVRLLFNVILTPASQFDSELASQHDSDTRLSNVILTPVSQHGHLHQAHRFTS